MQEKPSFQMRSTKTSQLFIQIGVTARTHEQEATSEQNGTVLFSEEMKVK